MFQMQFPGRQQTSREVIWVADGCLDTPQRRALSWTILVPLSLHGSVCISAVTISLKIGFVSQTHIIAAIVSRTVSLSQGLYLFHPLHLSSS